MKQEYKSQCTHDTLVSRTDGSMPHCPHCQPDSFDKGLEAKFASVANLKDEDTIDTLVRDFTSIPPRSKSEVRRRLVLFLERELSFQAKGTRENTIEEIEKIVRKIMDIYANDKYNREYKLALEAVLFRLEKLG